MPLFIHPQAICESEHIGDGTRIWAFAHVLPNAVIGKDCNICDGVFVENDVQVGDRVTVKCGVQLWDGVRLADDVFVGPNATFTNDRLPRSRQYPAAFEPTLVNQGASVGANATLLPGITIGAHAMVGAGTVVTRSVPPYAIVVGNPGRIIGYADTYAGMPGISPLPGAAGPSEETSPVAGVRVQRLVTIQDLRGDLTALEFETEVPFQPRRVFTVSHVSTEIIRGEHAHRTCKQFLVCVAGGCSVVADDGTTRAEFRLDTPTLGLYLPPMVWATQYKYSSDAILLVFASEHYRASDYIRSYDEFITLLTREAPP
jgi:acetyltransferase-like isoleucine patch superfamily enzyme/dTDP-4-dehydrorhamnose 3,5-epimerase-like enzyme